LLREELLETVRTPFAVLEGNEGEDLAVRRLDRIWIVVAYREISEDDGFIITSFLSKSDPRIGRVIRWPLT